ncbi:PD-(D/E)XK nuclease family protein [Piscinibacter koreensis]|uniref:PD-(D/E)XK nuclease family protein n=1 Tax=Piscinibacter koreensis TaxID=2742824 RepID=A0A7Y6NSI2_9BURK|nr:PD-(D/E)XK nuclease family protein [Schlegelella koreensis]NUZ08530.1 PD-(D/E)XK nuclease family protein [Schlegelella koreensis]
MSDAISGALLLVGLLFFSISYLWLRGRQERPDESWLPRELAGGQLAFAEKRFESRRHGLVARLDRAYRAGDQLHLVELKTRAYLAAHVSDVIELSVQRLVLEAATGEPVSSIAHVAVQLPDRSGLRTIRVELFDEHQVMAMRQRLLQLRDGKGATPLPAPRRRACEKCGHRTVCQRTYGDRE